MALRKLSFSPSFVDSGATERFNRFDRLLSQISVDEKLVSLPSYDIRQCDDTHYYLTVSVPGWSEDELEIETVGGQLTINGKKKAEEKDDEDKWIHRGINRSNFQLTYSLPDHVNVTGARLEHGLLTIQLYHEIPESEKPKKISIDIRKDPVATEREVIEHNADELN